MDGRGGRGTGRRVPTRERARWGTATPRVARTRGLARRTAPRREVAAGAAHAARARMTPPRGCEHARRGVRRGASAFRFIVTSRIHPLGQVLTGRRARTNPDTPRSRLRRPALAMASLARALAMPLAAASRGRGGRAGEAPGAAEAGEAAAVAVAARGAHETRRQGRLPPHVLAAVEEKARLRRIDERAHFWVRWSPLGPAWGRAIARAVSSRRRGGPVSRIVRRRRRRRRLGGVRRVLARRRAARRDRGCVRRHPGQDSGPAG